MTAYKFLSNNSKIWIYQAQQPLSEKTIPEIRKHLTNFVTRWVSHNNQLKAFGEIYHRQFIVLMVDESQVVASGCSIDESVRFLKQLEEYYGLNLFDRMTFTYKDGDTIKSASSKEFGALYRAGEISDSTLVFDNLVKTKGEFEEAWLKPLSKSWHKRMV